MKQLRLSVFLSLILVGGCAERQSMTEVPVVAGVSLELAVQRATLLSKVDYQLKFVVPVDQTANISGTVKIQFELASADLPLQLDFREDPDSVVGTYANGTAISPVIKNEHILIPAEELVVGENSIFIEFIAGDTSLNRNPEFLYTLFVPDRARTAFPLFDQPDLKATFELALTVPENWTAMSNAEIESVTQVESGVEYQFLKSERISSYLFAFVAGMFETIERDVNGRMLTMLHRETDTAKVARNIDEIFKLHADSIDWLENYTDIAYPYQKFGFVLIPSFQYGGMEHVGAIQYRAASLFLDEAPSDTQLLGRASLIAHETAHMWFGNLVTMEWFNDVWTKEVFANFMAAKIVNPGFPAIDHDLNFLVRHYPSAFSVDRTAGANPIRQALQNLNEAGQMYGAIIYNKAPIMMRQLEEMLGADVFREGMQEYLSTYAFANATWPALVEILDRKSADNVSSWSDVWVNGSGRPQFHTEIVDTHSEVTQVDASGRGRVWPQSFGVSVLSEAAGKSRFAVVSDIERVQVNASELLSDADFIFNADGKGYGLFPTTFGTLQHWAVLEDVEKGAALINLYEGALNQPASAVIAYYRALASIVVAEENQLLINLGLRQLEHIFWTLLPASVREEVSSELEVSLWDAMLRQSDSSRKKIYFDAFAGIALSPQQVSKAYDVWSGSVVIDGLPLAENDTISLAQMLAIKLPDIADEIVAAQLARIENPDNRRKFEFIEPSLSANPAVRARFVAALAAEENRAVESWVLAALRNIHHPLRIDSSEQFILQSLALLEEVQVTGDIFFPKRWLDATLENHRSGTAVNTVATFLHERPDYNAQLKMKILQSADMLQRANRLTSADRAAN